MTLGDVYFVLFRRKWLILGFFLAGILGALAVCLSNPPQYKSEAELSLSVLEAKSISVPGEESRPMNEPSENSIDTETKILQSLDLAQQVVQAMTPAKILAGAGDGADTNAAAYLVKKGLTVESTPGSSVIHITFQHPDKAIVQPVLTEIIDGYFVKHFKMRGGGVFGNFPTNETIGEPSAKISSEQYDAYRRICARLVMLNSKEDDFLTQQGFTEENVLVKEVRSQIANAQKIKTQLEEKYPPLASLAMPLLNMARGTTDMANDLPNDCIIQSPTPPLKGWSKKIVKTARGLAVGGILAGLALAFLLELVLAAR